MAKLNPVQLQKFLKGIDYPASKDKLVSHAREHGADDKVCAVLEKLSKDEFTTPAEVSKAVGQVE